MEEIAKAIEDLKKKVVKTESQPKKQESHHCNECQDKGYIFTTKNGYQVGKKCKCAIAKEAKARLNKSGLGDLLETKTFDNYQVNGEYQEIIKRKAKEYIESFLSGEKCSFSILGQSGVGKTHITTAISKRLMDNGIEVKYYTADEIIQNLQATKFDEENYNREFSKIVKADVLFIDDLFKSSITNYYQKEKIKSEDLREIFKVINCRYNKKLPILLNSEIHFERFIDIDQAFIGRINEMCKSEYLISIKPDTNKNYRLSKKSI